MSVVRQEKIRRWLDQPICKPSATAAGISTDQRGNPPQLHENAQGRRGAFPGIVGYENPSFPKSTSHCSPARHAIPREKGQAKSRLMRSLVRFLDPEIPYLDIRIHQFMRIRIIRSRRLASDSSRICPPIRYPSPGGPGRAVHERLAPGTKFADVIGKLIRQTRNWYKHVSRGSVALRPDPAHAPRHLRHERNSGVG